jgi:hypothetical protein
MTRESTVSVIAPAIRPDTDSKEAGRVALTFFFNLTEKWGCSADQQRTLLGDMSKTSFYRTRPNPCVMLSRDVMDRISYLMGIHKTLRIIFSTQPERAVAWISKENTAAPFNGKSALEYMLAGGLPELADVRRYLDGMRG